MEVLGESETMPIPQKPRPNAIRVSVRKRAYQFDGRGNLKPKNWNISEGVGSVFNWYHVELPKENQKSSIQAQSLISVLCPPLKLQDILTLVNNGPFCGNVNGAMIFRVNSPGPGSSDFTLRIAARVTDNCIITVSLGRVPRLGFGSLRRKSLLSLIPRVEDDDDECFAEEVGNDELAEAGNDEAGNDEEVKARNGEVVINEKLLDSLLSMSDSEMADQHVPARVVDLLMHIVDAHVDQVQHMVAKLERELDSIELLLHRGDSMLKKEILDGGKCSKMHLNLQRLIQIVDYGEQVFPDVGEKCAINTWFTSEDNVAFGELIGRLRRLKERLGFLTSRVTAAQAGLDSWQAQQIKRKLYYIFFCSMISLPLSIVITIFRMNVGGLPWTGQSNKYDFRNVMLVCAAILSVILVCVAVLFVWKRRRALSRC